MQVCLRPCCTIRLLWASLLPSWISTICYYDSRPRLGTEFRNSILRYGFLERCILLLPQFWQRRFVSFSRPPTSSFTNKPLGSVPVATWAFRACVIQGSQQIYVAFLWFWGSQLTNQTVNGIVSANLAIYGSLLTAIATPIAILLWVIGVALFLGLPDYYRQAPGQIPSFYKSVMRRKIVLWFFVAVLIQNFFLSAPYGRNWRYLWSSAHAPTWMIVLLVFAFFVGVWAILLGIFSRASLRHSWILPMFAVGLGAPRWCQMLWATSGMGSWVPWAGSPLAGALAGRALWLWLGTLDAVQGVGFGMILLQTLTRFHVVFSLVCAQVLGSIATIVARACAPDATGPGPIFPNLALSLHGLKEAWFWIGLIAQIIVCVGFFRWFRKEQLTKP